MLGWQPSPAYINISFSLRSTAICRHQFGTMTSPTTHGNHGDIISLHAMLNRHSIQYAISATWNFFRNMVITGIRPFQYINVTRTA